MIDTKLANYYDLYICIDNKVQKYEEEFCFILFYFISNLEIALSISDRSFVFNSLTVVLFPRVY